MGWGRGGCWYTEPSWRETSRHSLFHLLTSVWSRWALTEVVRKTTAGECARVKANSHLAAVKFYFSFSSDKQGVNFKSLNASSSHSVRLLHVRFRCLLAMSCLDVMYQVYGPPQPYFAAAYSPYHHQVWQNYIFDYLFRKRLQDSHWIVTISRFLTILTSSWVA